MANDNVYDHAGHALLGYVYGGATALLYATAHYHVCLFALPAALAAAALGGYLRERWQMWRMADTSFSDSRALDVAWHLPGGVAAWATALVLL